MGLGGGPNIRTRTMTMNFAQYAWDTDAMEAITRLAMNRKMIRNPNYFYQTAHLIEDCRDPSGNGPLTILALANWEAKCLTAPAEDDPAEEARHANTPRTVHPQD